MSSTNGKQTNRPMPAPTWKPSPPEMEFEPVPMPRHIDDSSLDNGDDLLDEGRVPAVPSRDEANLKPDEALPEDAEEALLKGDPSRDKTRFDEEIPRSSR